VCDETDRLAPLRARLEQEACQWSSTGDARTQLTGYAKLGKNIIIDFRRRL
jgi:hypothetical protein